MNGHGKVLDQRAVEQLAHSGEDLLGADHARRGQGDVQQAQHVELRQASDPLGVSVELPGGVEPADESSHRRSRDGDNLDAAFLEHLDDADMRVTPRAPAAERERRAYRVVHGTSVEVAIPRGPGIEKTRHKPGGFVAGPERLTEEERL